LIGDPQAAFDGRFGSLATSPAGTALDDNGQPASKPVLGLFSGKPMRFMFAPIFNTQFQSGAANDSDRRNALDDLLQGYARSRPSPFDAGVASPPAQNRQNLFSSGSGVASSANSPGVALASPTSTAQNSQEPLSLNDAYLLYLKQMRSSGPQVSPIANPDAAGAPLVPPNDAVGNSINGLSPNPESSDQSLSLMDAYLLYLKRLEASRSPTIDTAAGA
jgi:hypothetical protein